jgi:hypothetical protein
MDEITSGFRIDIPYSLQNQRRRINTLTGASINTHDIKLALVSSNLGHCDKYVGDQRAVGSLNYFNTARSPTRSIRR